MPDPSATFQLYDRIVNVREGYTVPLGLKGTIIGIHKPNSSKESETLYDVLFDHEFPGGLALNCSANRGYRMPRPALINISYGQRVYEQRKTGKIQYCCVRFKLSILQHFNFDTRFPALFCFF